MAWLAWCRLRATPSTSCSAPTSVTCDCCGAGWTSSRVRVLSTCGLKFYLEIAQKAVCSLSTPTRVYPSWASQYVEVGYIRLRWERVGVRGYDLSLGRNPSPELLRNSTSPDGRGGAKCAACVKFQMPDQSEGSCAD